MNAANVATPIAAVDIDSRSARAVPAGRTEIRAGSSIISGVSWNGLALCAGSKRRKTARI